MWILSKRREIRRSSEASEANQRMVVGFSRILHKSKFVGFVELRERSNWGEIYLIREKWYFMCGSECILDYTIWIRVSGLIRMKIS